MLSRSLVIVPPVPKTRSTTGVGAYASGAYQTTRNSPALRRRGKGSKTSLLTEKKRLSIRLLGPPKQAWGDVTSGSGERRRSRCCAIWPPRGMRHRRELAGLLWPHSEERRARTDLRSSLAGLRKALEQDNVPGRGLVAGDRLLAIEVDWPLMRCLVRPTLAPCHALATSA